MIAATVLAMDIANALSAMWGDAVKLATFDWIGRVALISLVLLPAGSLALIFRGNRRGWVPLGISFAVVSVWFLYYATDWWGPVGDPNAFWIAVLVLGVGWAVTVRQWVKELRSVRS